MPNTSPLLDIVAPQVVIVATGDTPQAQANGRGHLFEKFVARLFEAYGCAKPKVSNVNVRSNGYEVDIVTAFTLTSARAIAECKAYSAPLPVAELNIFYSKLCTDRFVNPGTHGWFVAIPNLTKDGHELARLIEKNDLNFKLITSTEIYELVLEQAWITPIIEKDGVVLSDEALLITSTGVCAIAKQLDPVTRLPQRVLVHRKGGLVGTGDVQLVSATDYSGGLPVLDVGAEEVSRVPALLAEAPALVTVVGSRADFEYQYPAAPEFFVGRVELLTRVQNLAKSPHAGGSVLVLNAQSGWGKSSLALRLAFQVESAGGYAIVFDTRTAAAASYVSAALRRAITEAAAKNKISLPAQPSFASLQSSLATLSAAYAQDKQCPMLIFFDQFENVFRNNRLTQEFRDLALGIRELKLPIQIGFSWKTDFVGLTEGYPYQLRDEIRGAALVLSVDPFGPKEVGTLLGRLAKAAGKSLSNDLRQRLREYSQGLPWLLKKLASHILMQLQAGTTEETLLAEALNIEGLFEQDLSAIGAHEIEALKMIAREAPVAVSEIVERVSPEVIQSLVDQRLVVRVGERLDTYWDTFREFLVTGKVAVEDTYILRQRPMATSNLLKHLAASGGEANTNDVAHELATSVNVVFNLSRDLRQMGILAPRPGSLVLAQQLRVGKLAEAHVQERVAKALRRHKVFSTVQKLLAARASHEISVDELVGEMPSLFPAMEAKTSTWRVYAFAFASWFDYAGLVQLRGQMLCYPISPSRTRLLGGMEPGHRRTFPQTRPNLALQLLRTKIDGTRHSLTPSAQQKSISDWQALGVLDENGEMREPAESQAILDVGTRSAAVLGLLKRVPGASTALGLLETEPGATSMDVGTCIKEGYGLQWAATTTSMAGGMFRSWAAAAGVGVIKGPRKAARKAT